MQSLASSLTSGSKCNRSHHRRRVDRSAIARTIVDEWNEVQSLALSSTSGTKCNRTHHRRRVDRSAIARIIVDEWTEVQSLASSSTSGSNCITYSHSLLHQFKAVPLHFCHQSIYPHQFSDRNLPVLLHRFEGVQSLVSLSPSGTICFT